MGKLDGKISLITGGSHGIGFATDQHFLNESAARVFITGRSQDDLNEAIKNVGNRKVTDIQGDTSNLNDLEKLFDTIKNKQGHLDIVFANAAIYDLAPLESITEQYYKNLFNVHVKGVLFPVQKCLPLLVNGRSVILNASFVSLKGFPNHSVYAATKAALRSFARTWTVDLKERKILVNTLSPRPIDTPGLRKANNNEEQTKQMYASLPSETVMGHVGTCFK